MAYKSASLIDILQGFTKDEILALMHVIYEISIVDNEIADAEEDYADRITEAAQQLMQHSAKPYNLDLEDAVVRREILNTDIDAIITNPQKRSVVLAIASGMAEADLKLKSSELNYLHTLSKQWDMPIDTALKDTIKRIII